MSTDVSTSFRSIPWNPETNPLKLFCPQLEELEQQLLQSYDDCESWRLALEAEQTALATERGALQSEQESLRKHQAEYTAQQAAFQLQRQQAKDNPLVKREEIESLQEKLLIAEQEIELLRELTGEQSEWAEQHKQERNQHDEQYSALELELEHVRNRAGELFDTLACSRSEWDLEKNSWELERQELQSLLAHQQAQIKDYLVRHESHTAEAATVESSTSGSETTAKKEDTVVVGSVLAQFERIRNERAVRRRKAGEGG